MLPQNNPDRIRIVFDDHCLVANAGLLLPATPCTAPGPEGTRRPSPRPRRRAGAANTGDKLLTLVASALAGADCTDDADALRAGGTACTLLAQHDQGAIHPGHPTIASPCPSFPIPIL